MSTTRTIKFLWGIKRSIKNDVKSAALFHSRRRKIAAGFFSIPREVFCYVDYLGKIVYGGEAKSEKAIAYIKRFFPSHYRKYAHLLYNTWRHGTVHEYQPKRWRIRDPKLGEIKVHWLSSNTHHSHERRHHLKTFSRVGLPRSEIWLNINTCQLVDDLLISTDNLILHARRNPYLRRQYWGRINRFRALTHLKPKKKYEIKIYQEIKRAKSSRAGEIDARGNVVKLF